MISASHRALLEQRLRGGGAPRQEGIPRRGHDRSSPLSFAQQRLWLLDQLEPGTAVYNVPLVWRLRGSLRLGALQRCLSEIVRRHEVLRTTLTAFLGQPRQVVAAAGERTLPLVDLAALAPEVREREAARLSAREARRPFRLDRDAPLRTLVLRLTSQEHRLLACFHHVATDGWSLGPFLRELVMLYDGFAEGRPSPLAELPVQYADFAEWQHRRLAGEQLERQLAWWRAQLTPRPPDLGLPVDHPRGQRQETRGAICQFTFPPATLAALRRHVHARGGTPFVPLLTALAALLARTSGQDDFVFAVPTAGRERPELEGLIGFFVNTLAVRADLAGEPTFETLEQRLRRTVLGAYDHAELPFEKLVEDVVEERDPSRPPLAQVSFNYHTRSPGQLRTRDFTLESIEGHTGTAKFDLVFAATDAGETLWGSVEHSRLFDPTTARRLADGWRRLLAALLERGEVRVGDAPILSPAGRHQLLVEHNDTLGPPGEAGQEHELFEEQASQRPDAVAITAPEGFWTYGTLSLWSGHLACRLAAAGVRADDRVGLLIERSAGLVAAMLGVLAAGGAYLALDTEQPVERLRQILIDAGCRVLVSRREPPAALVAAVPRVVSLDAPTSALFSPPAKPIAERSNLAYVIFTSGSTGRPKGVGVTHANLASLLSWHRAAYALTPDDRAPWLASLAFDASVWELWPYLSAGASLALPPAGAGKMPGDLRRFFAEQRITLAFLPTPLAEAAVGELAHRVDRPEGRLTMRALLTGGDLLHGGAPPGAGFELYNHYGPTEVTVVSTAVRVPAQASAPPPIGRPIGGLRAIVADRALRPLPLGAAGELLLGGAGVARGYLGRPAATAERFAPDPFGATGERLYKSGDLARWRCDGNLEFLGRIDHQVKVRGARIEPGEVEAVLLRLRGVREAVVMARGEGAGCRLVAYVARDGGMLSDVELRNALVERLPAVMVPAQLVALDELPRTATGKIDRAALGRRALPDPGADRPALATAFVAPRDALERQLAQLWRGVLGVRSIGVHDDFFTLGGQSMLAVRLLAEIERSTGRRLEPVSLFEAPDIARQAELLRRQMQTVPRSPLIAIQPSGTRSPLVCIHPVGGNVVCYYELARHLGADQPVFGLQAPRLDAGGAPYPPIETMAAEYLEAIGALAPANELALLGWSFGGLVAFEMALQLARRGQPPKLVALLDTHPPERVGQFAERADDATILAALAREHAQQLGLELAIPVEPLRALGDHERLAAVLAELRRVGAAASEVETEWLERILTVYHAGLRVTQAYRPRAAYPGRVVLLKPTHVTEQERHELDGIVELAWDDPTNGWSAHCASGVESIPVPGNHATMAVAPHVAVLAERLRHALDSTSPPTYLQPTVSTP